MGGDHKCPLCSATFTRPQHVGRHLRAHTGDRPYECKECPLRFARSDLLSRHVNKAHRPPDENGNPPAPKSKRGRRKSTGVKSDGESVLPKSAQPSDPSSSAQRLRAASFSIGSNQPLYNLPNSLGYHDTQDQGQGQGRPQTSHMAGPSSQQFHPPPHTTSGQQIQNGSQVNAHTLYPHHPLLNNSNTMPMDMNSAPQGLSGSWTSTHPSQSSSSTIHHPQFLTHQQSQTQQQHNQHFPPNFSDPFSQQMGMLQAGQGLSQDMLGNLGQNGQQMRWSESGQGGLGMPGMQGQNIQFERHSISGWNPAQGVYDFGFKKRACDQCNHSKVRCDFADPCIRCINKNLHCTYIKPPKTRAGVQTLPTGPRLSLPDVSPNTASRIITSMAPTITTFTSPQSAILPGVHASPFTSTSPLDNMGNGRRRSIASIPAHQYLPTQYPQTQMVSPDQYLYHSQQNPQNAQQISNQGGVMIPGMMDYSSSSMNSQLIPQQIFTPSSGDQQSQIMSSINSNGSSIPSAPSMTSMASIPSSFPSVPGPSPRQMNPALAPLTTLSTPSTRQVSNPVSIHSRHSDKSLSTSPPMILTHTPALTSHSTSPSGPEEPPESMGQRSDSIGYPIGIADGVITAIDMTQKMTPNSSSSYRTGTGIGSGSQTASGVLSQNSFSPIEIQPTALPSASLLQQNLPHVQNDGNGNNTIIWPIPDGIIDPRLQFRGSVSGQSITGDDNDDGTASVADSNILSHFLDQQLGGMEGNAAFDEHRRRASVSGGIWATAFNNMTLQDPSGNSIPLTTALADPVTSNHLAQSLVQSVNADGTQNNQIGSGGASGVGAGMKRPGYPILGADGSKHPSMADVKELWKLFMSDPLTGSTPAANLMNSMDWTMQNNINNTLTTGYQNNSSKVDETPRPGIGRRTLSKSNSAPDLTSPSLFQQTNFFNPNNTNGNEGDDSDYVKNDGLTLDKWKDEIKQRQALFAMNMIMQPKKGRGNSINTEEDFANLGVNGLRPNAAVLQQQYRQSQGGPSLNITLAPERLPSFGTPSSQTPNPASAFQAPAYNHKFMNMNGYSTQRPTTSAGIGNSGTSSGMGGQQKQKQKPTSATARPGNKRLASQTLMGHSDKGAKTSFEVYDEDDVDGDDEADEGDEGNGAGSLNGSLQFGMVSTNGGVGGLEGLEGISSSMGMRNDDLSKALKGQAGSLTLLGAGGGGGFELSPLPAQSNTVPWTGLAS